jgi:hypothetical protein
MALIYQWKHLRCHSITEKRILCNAITRETDCGIPALKYANQKNRGLYRAEDFWRLKSNEKAEHFDSIFKDESDIEKIVIPEIHYDKEATQKKVDYLNNEVFDGILPVFPRGFSVLSFTPWDHLFQALGLQEGLMYLSDKPDFMKALANKYIELYIAHLQNLERLGLLNYNTGPALIGVGGYGCTTLLPGEPEGKGVMGAKAKESWGFASDQIFTGVSPEMSNEFAFEMEKVYAEKFGLFYYGCCEKLDHKLDYVLTLPHIHKISCSPFSIKEKFFEEVGDKAVVSFKPDSILLSHLTWDVKESRDELITVCKLARKYNCHVEAIMKTLINIGEGPKRLWDWSEMAVDVFNNY